MGEPNDPPKPIAPMIVTDELLRRPLANPDYLHEKLAIQDLAQGDPGSGPSDGGAAG